MCSKLRIIEIAVLTAILTIFGGIHSTNATSDIQTSGQLWTDGMARWDDSITVEPGDEFKITLFAGNYSQMDISAIDAIIKDSLPTIPLPSGGEQNVAYIPGSTEFYYDSSGNWNNLTDDGTSPFDGSGFPVTEDGDLDPFESANYKYTVRMPDTLPAGTSSLSREGPALDFDFNGSHYTIQNSKTNTISVSNLPDIINFSFNGISFEQGDTIMVEATASAGKNVHVEIGGITIQMSESSPGEYIGSYSVSESDAVQNQNARLYVVDSDSKGAYLDYGDSITIAVSDEEEEDDEEDDDVAPSVVRSGGSIWKEVFASLSSSAYLSESGDSVQTSMNTGITARISVESSQQEPIQINISEADFDERKNASMPEEFGEIIMNSVFSVKSPEGENDFPEDAYLYFTGKDSHFNLCPAENIRIASHTKDDSEWLALATTVREEDNVAYSRAHDYGLYSLVCFAKDDAGYTGEGIVEGATSGVYPDGSLLKSPGSSDIWHIENGFRHLVDSNAFSTRYEYEDVIQLPSAKQINLYQKGERVGFKPGTLVRENGSSRVYRFSANNILQPFESFNKIEKRGYQSVDILEVEEGRLDSFSSGAYISDPGRLYTGDLVKAANNPTVYYFENGLLRPIYSWRVFEESQYNPSSIMTVSNETIGKYGRGSCIYYPDAALIKSPFSASVYVMSNGVRRPIRSAEDFDALLYGWNNIITVPRDLMFKIPVGRLVAVISE